jgi:hypothetical protein
MPVTHSHLSLQVVKSDLTDLLPWTCSNLLHNVNLDKLMSNDDPMWYSLPYHVTTLQKMYGTIPELPSTSEQMLAKLVFPEQCHRKHGARN